MGKKRTITIGSEEEATQKEEARKRREVKKAAKSDVQGKGESEKVKVTEEVEESTTPTAQISPISQEETANEPKATKKPEIKDQKKHAGSRHTDNMKQIDKNKVYTLKEALETLTEMKPSKMDETLELHINTHDKTSGNVTLPHGNGKSMRVAILAPTQDAAGADELLKKIDAGQIDFDILIATPDAMPRLAKAAKVLGPKGLMPNPKNGTVTPNPKEAAEKFAGGQMNYKTEAKANIIHVGIGKMSFGKEKLVENAKAFLAALDNSKVRSIYIKSTMSPALRMK